MRKSGMYVVVLRCHSFKVEAIQMLNSGIGFTKNVILCVYNAQYCTSSKNGVMWIWSFFYKRHNVTNTGSLWLGYAVHV